VPAEVVAYNGGFGQTGEYCIAVVEFAQNEYRDENGSFVC